jgi:hypothetical protein
MGTDLQDHNKSRGTTLTAQQFAKSKHARSSFASLTVEMAWLLPKFEKFKPEFWHCGVVSLVLRLAQTSLMALLPSQNAQAAIVSLLTLVALSLIIELSPMRRASDNRVAVLSQGLIFIWVILNNKQPSSSPVILNVPLAFV